MGFRLIKINSRLPGHRFLFHLLESFLELVHLDEDVGHRSSHGVAFGDTDPSARLLGHQELKSWQVQPLNHPEQQQEQSNDKRIPKNGVHELN
jgi:hypothetical protein